MNESIKAQQPADRRGAPSAIEMQDGAVTRTTWNVRRHVELEDADDQWQSVRTRRLPTCAHPVVRCLLLACWLSTSVIWPTEPRAHADRVVDRPRQVERKRRGRHRGRREGRRRRARVVDGARVHRERPRALGARLAILPRQRVLGPEDRHAGHGGVSARRAPKKNRLHFETDAAFLPPVFSTVRTETKRCACGAGQNLFACLRFSALSEF